MDQEDGFKLPVKILKSIKARQSKLADARQKNESGNSPPTSPVSSPKIMRKTKSNSKSNMTVVEKAGKTPKKKTAAILAGNNAGTGGNGPTKAELRPIPNTVIKSRPAPSNPIQSQPTSSTPTPHLTSIQQPTSTATTTPSKTLSKITQISEAREIRRQKLAQMIEFKHSMDEDSMDSFIYKGEISRFNTEFEAERKRLEGNGKLRAHRKDIKIRVCVRKRPLHPRELEATFDTITTTSSSYPYSHIYIHEPKQKVDLSKHLDTHQFVFDDAFDEKADNRLVYDQSTRPIVDSFLAGGRATFFAYGQTGSGKTHTIFGKPKDPGIYMYTIHDIFRTLASPSYTYKTMDLRLTSCFFEIYGGRVFDLLNGKNRVELLEDKQGKVQVFGLRNIEVDSEKALLDVFETGRKARTTGSTEANPESSRSHAIFQLTLLDNDGKVFGKLSLVDLAGSERGVDTGDVSRQARIEGAEINKSLLALKECIRALHAKESGAHVPFRASKLTQILRDSLIGKGSKTVMIATVSPGAHCVEHTLNTLRYADRVKEFKARLGERADMIQSPILDELESLGYGLDEYNDENENDGEYSDDSKDDDSGGDGEEQDALDYLRLKSPEADSAEMYSLTNIVKDVLREEDELTLLHRKTISGERESIAAEEELLDAMQGEDHDVDIYCARVEELLESKMAVLDRLLGKVKKLRGVMAEEEQTIQTLFGRFDTDDENDNDNDDDDNDDDDDDAEDDEQESNVDDTDNNDDEVGNDD